MTQRVKRADRLRNQREREAAFQRFLAVAKAWAHETWLLIGACNRMEEGHDANCRCHNGSPVLLDTRPPAQDGSDA